MAWRKRVPIRDRPGRDVAASASRAASTCGKPGPQGPYGPDFKLTHYPRIRYRPRIQTDPRPATAALPPRAAPRPRRSICSASTAARATWSCRQALPRADASLNRWGWRGFYAVKHAREVPVRQSSDQAVPSYSEHVVSFGEDVAEARSISHGAWGVTSQGYPAVVQGLTTSTSV